jgi:hypothetical protein
VAELMAEVLTNEALRRRVLATQERLLQDLRSVDYRALLLEKLAPVLS